MQYQNVNLRALSGSVEVTGSIHKIYASTAITLLPSSFGHHVDGGADKIFQQNFNKAIAIPAGSYFEGPIISTKFQGIGVVYHGGFLKSTEG
tara:strand:- start:232 stop:507 length:276 start_codon:yes stop_codon:yes gene_type:complete